ncbi:MAG TPA: DapH/DapD/GlmU-related protein [Woeseiaceae bacterium]
MNRNTGARVQRRRSMAELDQDSFIRARLFSNERSAFARYADLAFHSFTWPKLIRYELLTVFVGPLPGALGFLLRKWLFPGLFRTAGRNVIFGPNLTLRHADRISLGDEVVLDRHCLLDARGAGDSGIVIGDRVIVSAGAIIQSKVGHIEIGADCNIGSGVHIVAQGPVIVGDGVAIAGNAMIAGGRQAVELEGDAAATRFTSGPIRIGRRAKIGMGAIVQDGVHIGEHAIVAPGAVVFEDVPPRTVVWGNPARPVRDRDAAPGGRESLDNGARCTNPAGSDARLRHRVRDYLRKDLFIEFGPGEVGDSDSLVAAGILDSLALVRLALWIEQTFQVEVDLGAVSLSEIDSVEKIAAWIGRRLEK